MRLKTNFCVNRKQCRATRGTPGTQTQTGVQTYDWVFFLVAAFVGILAFGVVAANADPVIFPNIQNTDLTQTIGSGNISDYGTGSETSAANYEVQHATLSATASLSTRNQ